MLEQNISSIFHQRNFENVSKDHFEENDVRFAESPIYRIISYSAQSIWTLSAVVGIPGNLLVIIAILRLSSLKTVSNVLIFNLAFADLCFLALTPLVVANGLAGYWMFGVTACKLFLTSSGINQFASATFLALLSLDRYLAVCHPIWSRAHRTPKAAVIISVVCWFFISLEMAPLLYFSDLVKVYPGAPDEEKQCMVYWQSSRLDIGAYGMSFRNSSLNYTAGLNDSSGTDRSGVDWTVEFFQNLEQTRKVFTFYTFVLSFLIPLLCVWFFYSNIMLNLFLRRQASARQRQGGRPQSSKVTLMVLAIVTAYTVFWIPFWFIQLSIEFNAYWVNNSLLFVCISYASYALQYINSALNPFLYAFLTNAFLNSVKGSCESCMKSQCCGNSNEVNRYPNCSAFVRSQMTTRVTSATRITTFLRRKSSKSWRATSAHHQKLSPIVTTRLLRKNNLGTLNGTGGSQDTSDKSEAQPFVGKSSSHRQDNIIQEDF